MTGPAIDPPAEHPGPIDPPADPPPVTRYYVGIFQSGFANDPLGMFDVGLFQTVQEQLDRTVHTPPERTEIDVWLESPGGDAHTAYKLFLELQHRCRRLRAVVPDYAKSAATLFLLGVDEFYMAPSAELGPLDAQIEHPDREGMTVSALDVSKALGFLGNFATDYMVRSGHQILRSTMLPRATVLREISRFSAAFLRPVVSKLDPHLIHRATYQLAVARSYAKTMLPLRRLSPEDQDNDRDDRELVEHLIEHYPAHGYVISRAEAGRLSLPVRNAEDYDRWEAVRIMHRLFHDAYLRPPNLESMIEVWTEQDLADITNAYHENENENDEAAADPDADPPA